MTDCLTFHYDVERTGAGDGAAGFAVWHRYLQVSLGSAVRGAALTLTGWNFQTGPHAGETHDVVIVATSANQVLAYAESQLRLGSSTPLWSTSLGTPVTRAGSNIPPPIGICSTPVLDPVNARLFVMAYVDIGGGASSYVANVLDLDTGAVIESAALSDPGAAGRPTFDPNAQDQRGALNLVNGRVYATFADFLAYDAGTYYGWVVSINAGNVADQWFFPVMTNLMGGGIWGPGGTVAAPDGTLYVATGNATNDDAAYWSSIPAGQGPGDKGDYFMAVVKLGVQYVGYRGHLAVLDWYQPTNIQPLNDADLDFGSSSVIALPTIAGRDLLVIAAKAGVYLLDRQNLGHLGNELWFDKVFGGESHSAPAYYHTPAGDDYVYLTGEGLPGLACYKVVPSAVPPMQVVWQANLPFNDSPGSPTVAVYGTSALVWVADAGDPGPLNGLKAFNALDGTLVFDSLAVAADDLGPVPHYPPVTCAGSSVFVGTASGFACYGTFFRKYKELKREIKEIKEHKPEFDFKNIIEIPKLKDAEGDPNPGDVIGDPWQALGVIAQAVDAIAEQLASMRAFIRPEERP
jgi:hypothetical protein